MKIKREKTAITRKKPSVPLQWALEQNLIKSEIYDWGCGKGFDSKWLKKKKFKVHSYDPYFNNQKTPDLIDFSKIKTILLLYVLNIIERRRERRGLLSDIQSFANSGTRVIVAVPTKKSVEYRAKKSQWKTLNDGYLTKASTFQKGYTLGEFINSCDKIGEILNVNKTNSGVLISIVEVK